MIVNTELPTGWELRHVVHDIIPMKDYIGALPHNGRWSHRGFPFRLDLCETNDYYYLKVFLWNVISCEWIDLGELNTENGVEISVIQDHLKTTIDTIIGKGKRLTY